MEAEGGRVEVVRLAEERRVADAPVQLVAPGVVHAPDDALEAAGRTRGITAPRVRALVRRGQPRAPVAAQVVVGVQGAGPVAHHDPPLAGDVGKIQARAPGVRAAAALRRQRVLRLVADPVLEQLERVERQEHVPLALEHVVVRPER